MPKREATPPPGNDEPKYLTICHPYPPHANMEIESDRLSLARWIACCMRQYQYLYAIFHKPSAPNMIIIEVGRGYKDFDRLLGAHKWSEFLLKPEGYSDKVSRIYYSTFSTGRAVEKAGWKRIFISDSWFQGFIFNNRFIRCPYPETSHCDLPSEDLTGLSLCRPLPLETFHIHIPAPPPARVGSASWVAQRDISESNRKLYAFARYAQTAKDAAHHSGWSTSNAGPGNSTRFSGSSATNNRSTRNVSHLQNSAAGESSACSSEGPSASDCDSSESMGVIKGNDHVAGKYVSSSGIEDKFGPLALHPTTNEDGKPLCPSHGVVCKKRICRDYDSLLKKIEKEEQKTSLSRKKNSGNYYFQFNFFYSFQMAQLLTVGWLTQPFEMLQELPERKQTGLDPPFVAEGVAIIGLEVLTREAAEARREAHLLLVVLASGENKLPLSFSLKSRSTD